MTDLNERYLIAKQGLFDKVYGQKLNPEQRRAVFTLDGPLLVLAGAGSGKTTVLVNRIGYLIKYGNAYFDTSVPDGVSEGMVSALEELAKCPVEEIEPVLPEFISHPCPPWNVLAFTFTNKAAGEIRQRLTDTLSDPSMAEAVWAGTFHSVCVRILRKYGTRLGFRDGFSIYDTDDQKRTVISVMKDLGIDEKTLNPKTVIQAISASKDSLVGPDDFKEDKDPRSHDVARVYREYQTRMMGYNALDFDDIIMQTVLLLKNDAEVLSYYQNKFRYVLVDEYQDTNYAQFVLTKLLSGGTRNLMVVGDDDQSIYKFRGATVENILNFDKTYPEATVVRVEQNYRSTENILNAANAVIHHNSCRHEKSLWSDKGVGAKIKVKQANDNIEEGKYIAEQIQYAVRFEGAKYSDFAVLYRINDMGRTLETTFGFSGIPHRIIGGQRFTDRKEIKDVLAYMWLVSTSDDDMRLKRIINEPKRKIGA
ncbi:MAG: UvrD-helicase domain-containing protein, partial [Clostridia bacterium]|nr:UvrD-helicase domain-containing protein [Clostridia bacterium]